MLSERQELVLSLLREARKPNNAEPAPSERSDAKRSSKLERRCPAPIASAGTLEGESAIDRVNRRKAEDAWVRAHPGALVRGSAPVPPPSLRGFPAACRRLMNAALWAMNEELSLLGFLR
jgi:hypothetical protein